MKTLFALLLVAISFTATAKPVTDTTAYWHIRINHKIVAKYNDGMLALPATVYERKEMNPADSLTIEFGNTTPCKQCLTSFYLLDQDNNRLLLDNGQGTASPLTASIGKILRFVRTYERYNLELYYNDGKKNYLVFRMKLK